MIDDNKTEQYPYDTIGTSSVAVSHCKYMVDSCVIPKNDNVGDDNFFFFFLRGVLFGVLFFDDVDEDVDNGDFL